MVPKMTVLTLGVRDIERSRGFYVEGLGWKPVMDVPGEVVSNGYFADPDGYRWEIAHNAGLTIDADGTVHMGPAA